jgi:hypothetical protein
MKYHVEKISTGVLILAIGLTFSGFDDRKALPDDYYYTHEAIRLEKSLESKLVNKINSTLAEKTYKKNEQLKPRELKQLLHDVGFRGEALKIAWATAMKESTGRPRSHNNNPDTGDNSYGLFQINMIGSLGPARLKQFDLEKNSDLFNPVRNAEIAFFMSNGGKNWSAWNGITENTRKWLKQYPTS